jgi:DNA-binding NarL/FixJ family response regulator
MNPLDQPLDHSGVARSPADATDRSMVLRFLHVEDNPADALLMQEYIRESCRRWNMDHPGAHPTSEQVVYTSVQFDLAERLAELTPARVAAADCAILDLSLPDASDLEALISLRAMSEDLPIIVLTGFDDLDVGLSALRYGADDYLVKSQVDGFTLDRAVRYAIARRRLIRDVAAAAAAATIDTAAVIMSAAVQAEVQRSSQSGSAATASPELARGTHQVSVQIGTNGDYSLHCISCNWQAERGAKELHSWAERSLDWILLRHMAFGDLPDIASTLPVPPARNFDISAPSTSARNVPAQAAAQGDRRARARS